MRCSACGAENAAGKVFCAHCGAKLEMASAEIEAKNFCRQCGAVLASKRFCPLCGADQSAPITDTSHPESSHTAPPSHAEKDSASEISDVAQPEPTQEPFGHTLETEEPEPLTDAAADIPVIFDSTCDASGAVSAPQSRAGATTPRNHRLYVIALSFLLVLAAGAYLIYAHWPALWSEESRARPMPRPSATIPPPVRAPAAVATLPPSPPAERASQHTPTIASEKPISHQPTMQVVPTPSHRVQDTVPQTGAREDDHTPHSPQNLQKLLSPFGGNP